MSTAQIVLDTFPSPFGFVHAVAVAGSAAVAGGIAQFSHGTMTSVRLAPTPVSLQQYAKAYEVGASSMPYFALGLNIAYAYAARVSYTRLRGHPRQTLQTSLYVLASVCAIGIAPFTLTAMKRVNGTLHRKAAAYKGKSEVSAAEAKEVEQLYDEWVVLNYLRAGLMALSCLFGTLAPLDLF